MNDDAIQMMLKPILKKVQTFYFYYRLIAWWFRKYEEAIEMYDKAIKINPNSA